MIVGGARVGGNQKLIGRRRFVTESVFFFFFLVPVLPLGKNISGVKKNSEMDRWLDKPKVRNGGVLYIHTVKGRAHNVFWSGHF